MNPFSRFRHYFIDDILSATDDVFDKARAELVFNFTVFFRIPGLKAIKGMNEQTDDIFLMEICF